MATTMFAAKALSPEERSVDPHLGYPRGFAKLCRHAYVQAQGLITPFSLGPPQTFHPYAPHDDELSKLKGYDDLFPVVVNREEERGAIDTRKHVDVLWQKLDHLENAGFDPAKFRLDAYGNVLYRDADPGSPLAWEIDYWFPLSRGGKAAISNLRLVQWQVCQRRKNKLEFLVPWWDLQLGVSANQFLSVFSSKHAEFRRRMFSLFFLDGASEQIGDKRAADIHPWSRHIRDCLNKVGFPASAIVRVQKSSEATTLRALNSNSANIRPGHLQAGLTGQRWSLEEEDDDGKSDLRGRVQPDSDKNKNHLRRGDSTICKENKYNLSAAAAIRAEQEWKQSLEEAKKQRIEEATMLESELRETKEQNLREKSVLERLEQALAKQKKRVEKQRKWSETQSQYRLCLEKMIRDTMHQCAVYKEQSRLNQAACNALVARLESQRSACDTAEMELAQKIQQRQDLEALVRPKLTKRFRHQGNADVGFCMKPIESSSDGLDVPERWTEMMDRRNEGREHDALGRFGSVPPGKQQPWVGGNWRKSMEEEIEEEEEEEDEEEKEDDDDDDDEDEQEEYSQSLKTESAAVSGAKRKVPEGSGDELDVVLLGYELCEQNNNKVGGNSTDEDGEGLLQKEESVGDNGSCCDEFSSSDGSKNNNKFSDNDAGSNNNSYYSDDDDNDDEGDFTENGDNGDQQGGSSAEAEVDMAASVVNPPGADEEEEEVVLVMQGKVKEAMVEAILEEEDEEERVKKLGKLNLDKWLQNLLLESTPASAAFGNTAAATLPSPVPSKKQPLLLLDDSRWSSHHHHHDVQRSTLVGMDAATFKGGGGHLQHNNDNNNNKQVDAAVVKKKKTQEEIVAMAAAPVSMPNNGGGGGGIIGGLLKKLTAKNNTSAAAASLSAVASSRSSGWEEQQQQQQQGVVDGRAGGGSRRLSMGDMVKKLTTTTGSSSGGVETERRQQSPWRWRSPAAAFRRSSSVGCDAKRSSSPRMRILSPWRRSLGGGGAGGGGGGGGGGSKNNKDAKAAAAAAEEERKVIESFSKLKVAAAAAATAAGKEVPPVPLEPRRSSMAILQRENCGGGGRNDIDRVISSSAAAGGGGGGGGNVVAAVATGTLLIRKEQPPIGSAGGEAAVGGGGGGMGWRKFSSGGETWRKKGFEGGSGGGAAARKDSIMMMRGGGVGWRPEAAPASGAVSVAAVGKAKASVGGVRYESPARRTAPPPARFLDLEQQQRRRPS